jgi:SNF2 family DNA or RNA helicase
MPVCGVPNVGVIISQKHCKIIVPYEGAVQTLWPDAKRLDAGVVLDHNVANTLLLRHIGYTVPSPISLYYDFPHPADEPPFKTQISSALMLSENNRAYDLSDMGTGKTRTTLWAWDFLNKTKMCKKMLVVCPISTMHVTWAKEVFTILPGRKTSVLYGSKKQRLEALAKDVDIYLVNHDGLKVIAKELAERTDIDVLVLDELAVYRNNSQRSKQMRKFAQRFNIVWGLTGAPMPNSPVDVWAQARIISPALAPKYQKQAKDLLMTQMSQYVWKPKANAVETAYAMLQPSIRHALDDVTELPEMIIRPVTEVPLSKQQAEVYGKIKRELVAMVHDKTITAHNAGVALNKLIQVASGWVYSKAPAFVKLDAEPRITALLDMVESCSHKVIVFVPFRHAIEGISEIFKSREVDHCVIHGDVGADDRALLINAFQTTDQYKVLLAHPGCVHHGLTLTAADTIIWYSPVLSLDVYTQACARIRRAGQKHKQQIFRLQATPVESRCYHLLRTKEALQDQLLQMLEDNTAESVQ